MTTTIPVARWLDVLDQEYLSTFLPAGGAAVKFAVTEQQTRLALSAELRRRCMRQGYLFFALEAGTCKVHMPHDIFFALARQIDWRLLARRLILRLLNKQHYHTEGIDPEHEGSVTEAVARANDLDPASILYRLRPLLETEVLKNPRMANAFRIAMFQICLIESERNEPGSYLGQRLLDWLKGIHPGYGRVSSYGIRTAINRVTARDLIESALFWIRHVGHAGTVVLLDNAQVTLARNPGDRQPNYTKATATEHYELLREFIDDADRLTATLLLVATAPDFVDDQSARGWGIYEALQTRVMDDVRDRNIVNPLAALVRLS